MKKRKLTTLSAKEHADRAKALDIGTIIPEELGWQVPENRRKNSPIFGACPFHPQLASVSLNLLARDFKISIIRQTFECRVCGEAGDVISFLRLFKKLTFKQAYDFLYSNYIAKALEGEL